MSNSALATLTAQYTDSENEDNNISPDSENSQASQVIIPSVKNTPQPTPETQVREDDLETRKKTKKKRSKNNVKRLVSYQDDTFVSDDERRENGEEDQEDEESETTQSTEEEEEKETLEAYRKNTRPLDMERSSKNSYNDTQNDEDNGDEFSTLQKNAGGETFSKNEKYTKYAHYGFSLPPEPKNKPLPELTEKIRQLYEKMENSYMDMNVVIQQRKDFRNPSIYEKLIQFCDINEFGTNYPPEMYDPLRWGAESFYEELDRVQCAEMAKRQKERKDKDKIEQVSALARKVEKEAKKRKSKWDQPATLKPSLPAALTTTVTGTKGTVISAFGSLPKKTT